MSKEKSSNVPSFETGMLAYARSVQITEGLFFATMRGAQKTEASQQGDGLLRRPIVVLEKGIRGQSSEDKSKNAGKSNPQFVEFAVIPQGHDGVELSYSIRFMPLSMQPHACNNTVVGESYSKFANAYREAGGFNVLAELLVWNIANARFAWRNRFQSDTMTVTVSFPGSTLVFNPMKLSLETPDSLDGLAGALNEGEESELEELITGIAQGLSNSQAESFNLKVRWNAHMAAGQEIFPSQEYVRIQENEAKKKEKGQELSRVYAKLPVRVDGKIEGQASMHSQKIGAALRHIDIWHGSDTHPGAIAVNPYGGVQSTGAVLRAKPKNSFYGIRAKAQDLFDGIEAAQDANSISADAHFFMANLLRGGVFGSSGKKAEANG